MPASSSSSRPATGPAPTPAYLAGFAADSTYSSLDLAVDASPSRRETTIEFAYARTVGQSTSLATFLSVAHQPGHDRDATPAAFGGIRFSLEF